MKLHLIAAACENHGIGFRGRLPWRLPKEMEYFTKMTTATEDPQKENVVIMGRKTWESIPPKYKPLSGRLNVVLSSSKLEVPSGVLVHHSLEDAIDALKAMPTAERQEQYWIIGGSSVYQAAINSPFCHRIYLTHINKAFECDTFMPAIDREKFRKITDASVPEELQEENGIQYEFCVYERY